MLHRKMKSDARDEQSAQITEWEKHYPPGVRWHDEIRIGPVHSMLDEARELYGECRGFDFLGKRWTWAQLADLSDRLAAGLQRIGVGKGVKVGLFLPNTPYYLIAYFAISKAGGTIVNFNPLYAEREILRQIEDSETDIIFTLDLKTLYGKLRPMLHTTRLSRIVMCPFAEILPLTSNWLFRIFKSSERAHAPQDDRHLRWSDLIAGGAAPEPVEIDPLRDIALLQYTGGTTGVPKGAMLTHANVTANVDQSLRWFPEVRRGQDKMLGVLPFFHVFAMTAVMNFSVRAGLEIIALPRFDLKQVLSVIAKKKPNFFPAVPAIYNAINNAPERDRFDLTSLRSCISGGAPLPVEVKRSFEANTGCVLVEGYGLTEASPVVCVNPPGTANRAGSIGVPLPGTEVALYDPDTLQGPLPVGARGELWVRGPQVMAGYWHRPAETDQVLRDGWLRTGDIATMDADGYVRIVDRLKDMIITNGYNVWPRNIEEAIYLHPGVEECIVAGLPDRERGEMVKAWIKPRNGHRMTTEDLKLFLADKISPIEMPRAFEFRNTPLPRTMIGKLSRKGVVEEEHSRA